MYLESLALDHFRNYERLRVSFEAGVVVFQGDNAQGKSNLLEAIYLLATTKSARARSDAELISWDAAAAANPLMPTTFARVRAGVHRKSGKADVEILIRDTPAQRTGGEDEDDEGIVPPAAGRLPKRFRLNGVVRRAGEMLGQVTAVYFAPTDVEIVSGSPAARRRYLDVMLCQLSQPYYRALQTYNRVISQRNALLRQVRDSRQPAATLEYWDDLLMEHGSIVIARRREAVAAIAAEAAGLHARLSGSRETLRVIYRPALGEAGGIVAEQNLSAAAIREAFGAEMRALRRKEIAQGVSLAGPHRDDMGFLVDGVDMTGFGSRGQQRTVALSLKMAELDYMRSVVGEWPILLLDDATSELDEARRAAILELARREEQVFITTADPSHLGPLLDSGAQRWSVVQGRLTPLSSYGYGEAGGRHVAEEHPVVPSIGPAAP